MKLIKRLIITALVVLGVGAVVSVSALAAAGFDINELDRQNYVERMEHISEGNVSSIKISSGCYDVKIVTSDKNEIDIAAFDGDDVKTSIAVEGNTVSIDISDNRSWYDKAVGSIGRDREVIIYIPANGNYAVSASSESGDIELEYRGTFASLELKSESGDIDLGRSRVSGNISVVTNSGDVEFENLDFASASIETRSGDVEGEIVGGYNFNVSTSSGRKRVPASDPSGSVFNIKTKSGDIEIEFDD